MAVDTQNPQRPADKLYARDPRCFVTPWSTGNCGYKGGFGTIYTAKVRFSHGAESTVPSSNSTTFSATKLVWLLALLTELMWRIRRTKGLRP